MESKEAYAKAERRRPVGWMELPTTLRDREELVCDERGEPMVIELHTPIWGEIEAGFEWADDFHQDILDMGWQACEGVPAMYYLADARMATIVDDFLITESSPDADVAERTIALVAQGSSENADADCGLGCGGRVRARANVSGRALADGVGERMFLRGCRVQGAANGRYRVQGTGCKVQGATHRGRQPQPRHQRRGGPGQKHRSPYSGE